MRLSAQRTFDGIFPRLTGRAVACGPLMAADHLAFLLNRPVNRVGSDGSLMAEGLLAAQSLYRSDFVVVFADVYVEAEALGARLEYYPDRNPQPTSYLMPERVEFTDITERGRVPELLRAADICRAELGSDFPVFYSLKDPFSLAALVVGPERFLDALLSELQMADSLLRTCLAVQVGLMEVVCSRGFIPLVGAPFASGSLLGPDLFRRFVLPNLLLLFDVITKRGSFRCLHLCGKIGNLSEVLPELNLDLLSFEEFVPAMWERMPETIPMGFVPTELFAGKDVLKVEQSVDACLAVMPRPALLASACDLPANANPDLVKAMTLRCRGDCAKG